MDKLITTPHDFIWRVKNPQDYWADTFKEVKYVCLNFSNKQGAFKYSYLSVLDSSICNL